MKQIKVDSMFDVRCEIWTISKILDAFCDWCDNVEKPTPETEALLAVAMLLHDRTEAIIEAIDAKETSK